MDRKDFFTFGSAALAAAGGVVLAGGASSVAGSGKVTEGRFYPPVTQISPKGHKVIHDRATFIEQKKYEDWNPNRDWKDDGALWLDYSYRWGQMVEPIQRRPLAILEDLYLLGPDDYHQCIYLFDTGDGLLLIDPSYDRFQLMIETQIRQLGYRLEDVRWVLLTHMHWDHGQSAAKWESRGVPIYIHEADRGYMTGELDSQSPLPMTPVKKPVTFKDGDKLTFGSLQMEAIHTPGHTPGSACHSLVWHGAPVLISGDIVLHFGRHAWMGASYCNWDDYLASLWKLQNHPDRSKWQVLLPGHGTVELEGAPDSIWMVLEVTSDIIRQRRAGSTLEWVDPHQLYWQLKQKGKPAPEVLKS
ncbi:MAG TPA: MBL fold metallo-hydrolase [Candidatus Glassbacteria bacterium]|nr:MBL fold metallo-hydrolase [Candidatus Glassbacteria bacterium]